jgi:exopolysaccharide biosynthesis polyprenyl glycosylphosphotransferase
MYSRIGRYILVQTLIYTPLFMVLARSVIWNFLNQDKHRVLLLGNRRTSEQVTKAIEGANVPILVVGFREADLELLTSERRPKPSGCTSDDQNLAAQCVALQVDELVACIGNRMGDETMAELMKCLSLGIRVSDHVGFIERFLFHVPVESIPAEWFLRADLGLSHRFYFPMKRMIDIAAALVGLVCSLPFLLFSVVAIKLESRGPAFYSHIRTGQYNRPFRIRKLRTMRMNAEQNGPQWASVRDDRVTRVGKILRRTRLDELPQFWNVLRGDISLVGPRPERPEFVQRLINEIPFYNQRHLVKPGLTGWAQINCPYGASVEDARNKLKYDLYYMKYCSLGLDLQIVLRTIGVVMKGAR